LRSTSITIYSKISQELRYTSDDIPTTSKFTATPTVYQGKKLLNITVVLKKGLGEGKSLFFGIEPPIGDLTFVNVEIPAIKGDEVLLYPPANSHSASHILNEVTNH